MTTAGPWEGHRRGSREYRRVLAALACAGVATFAQLYAPQGILPEISVALGVGPDRAGLLLSTATIGLAAGVLPWSWVADRVGRLPAMRAAMVAATVLGLAVTLCPGLPGILVLRTLEGVALGGLPALAITYLQEEVHPRHAALAAGTYVSGTSVGGLLGRLVAAPLAESSGWRWGVAAAVLLSALTAVGFMLLAPPARGFTRAAPDARVALLRTVRLHLRSRAMLALYAQGFLLMGGFVTVYSYLAFRLQRAPFGLPTTVTSLLFLVYLAGTWSARRAGAAVARHGRLGVLLTATTAMTVGVLLTLAPALPVVVAGLVLLTVGFFAGHSVAAGWTAARAETGRAQAAALYNLCYYLGSSVLGWVGGVVFTRSGWTATALTVAALGTLAAAVAAGALRSSSPARAGRTQTAAGHVTAGTSSHLR